MTKIVGRNILFLIAFLLLLLSKYSFGQENLLVREVISKCSKDSLLDNVRILSGETPFTLNNYDFTIQSRHSFQPGNNLAKEYLASRLQKYGLEVTEQAIDAKHQNVLGMQSGADNSKTVIICAHYDCCGNSNCDIDSAITAYGADDNASGVSAVLECARILSKIKTNYKIVYAFWDSEEQGWWGSKYFVPDAIKNKENIIAVINLDMIGYDSDNDSKFEIHADTTTNKLIDLPVIIEKVNSDYGIGLNPVVIKPGSNRSDQYAFWYYNINAVLIIEGFFSNDANKYYHSQKDRIDKFNQEYFFKISKLAIASIASIAEIGSQENMPAKYYLAQNYPNPFNSTTIISYQLSAFSHVTLKVYDLLGREVATLVNLVKTPGNYEAKFDGRNLSSGIYFYMLTTPVGMISKKMVYLK